MSVAVGTVKLPAVTRGEFRCSLKRVSNPPMKAWGIMVLKCHCCGVRVPVARACSYCGISQIERLHAGLVRVTYACAVAALLTTGVAFLGKSSEGLQLNAEDSGLPTQEEIGVGPEEVPWMFAKEMSDAVGREVTGSRESALPPEESYSN